MTGISQPGGISRAEASSTYARVFHPEAYGALGDGSTDDTAAVNATIAAAMTAGGGTVWLSPKRYLCTGALVTPYTGIPTKPVQQPCRITSSGGVTAGFLASAQTPAGAILDLRYDGTDTLHPAKIDVRGAGFLELDHVTIVSGGTDDFPIFQQTNTTTDIHHNAVFGNAANIGTACVQDAFIFGGVGDGLDGGSDSATAAFQGYGSKCHDNFFSHIRRGFLGQRFCNNVPVENNTFTTSCGSSTSGAIEFNGQDSGIVGCSTRGNTIEVPGYKYGVSVYSTQMSNFGPDGIYDSAGPYEGAYYFGTAATFNLVVDGYRTDLLPLVVEDPTVIGSNTFLTSHQNVPSFFTQGVKGVTVDIAAAVAPTNVARLQGSGSQVYMLMAGGACPSRWYGHGMAIGGADRDSSVLSVLPWSTWIPGVTVRRFSSASTADSVQVMDEAEALLTRIDAKGRVITKVTTAPVLADLVDGEIAIYTDGAGALKVAQRVAGVLTIKTATLT